jgi:hypothetical protein
MYGALVIPVIINKLPADVRKNIQTTETPNRNKITDEIKMYGNKNNEFQDDQH